MAVLDAAPPAFQPGELVDLSHAYDSQAISGPRRRRASNFARTPRRDTGWLLHAANSFFTSEHGGHGASFVA